MHRRDFLAAAATAGLAIPAHAFEREGARRNPVLLLDQPVATLDPHGRMDWTTCMVRDALYDALARHEGDPATVVPALAESWTTSKDGLTWTFRLAPAARFQNGDPVDAEAARASWVRALAQPGTAWMLRGHLQADGVTAPDPGTLRLLLTRPLPSLPGYLPHVAVINPRQVPADDPAWLATHSAGSGPYRLRRQDAGGLVLEAVPGHWRGWPMPAADRPAAVVLRVVPDRAARRAAFTRGQADLLADQGADGVGADGAGADGPGVATERRRGLTSLLLLMNTASGPAADLNVRRALAHAFPYAADAPASPFPPGIPGAQDVPDMPRQNLDAARQYAGKLPPAGLDLEYAHVAGDDEAAAAGRALAAAAAPLGLRLTLAALPWAELAARGAQPEGSPALAALRVTPCSADPDAVASLFTSAAAGQYWGMHHLRDDVLDKLVADARAEPDEGRRMAAYADVQRLIAAIQPAIFAGAVERRWTHRGLRGVAPSPVRGGAAVDLWRLHVPAS
jgi:peptide/nickel transport system substrate-binding protein